MHPFVNIAVQASREAGRVLIRSLNKVGVLPVREKDQNDFVTKVDLESERTIVAEIRRHYPSHAILAEESGATGDHEIVWIIDPLDGTANYLRGIPQFAISIAVQVRGELTQGVVYDPIKDELFVANAGTGALLNEHRIRVSNNANLERCILATGFPFRYRSKIEPYCDLFKDMLSQCADVRRAGAASLDLAYLAAGRVDGFWEYGLKPWDTAAGAVLVREAGGVVSDFKGRQNWLEGGSILAGNVKTHTAMHKILAPHVAGLLDEGKRKAT